MSKNNLEVWVLEIVDEDFKTIIPGKTSNKLFRFKTKEQALEKALSLKRVSIITKWIPTLNWRSYKYPVIHWEQVELNLQHFNKN